MLYLSIVYQFKLQMEEVTPEAENLNLDTPSHETLEEMMFQREEMMNSIDKQVVQIIPISYRQLRKCS